MFLFYNNVVFAKNELNLYSARQEVLIRPLIVAFSKETGIKVNIIAAKADQLLERLIREGNLSPADVLLTTDVARLSRAKSLGLLQPFDSELLKRRIPKNYRDIENYWFGLSLRARIVVYNKNLVNKNELKGYFDLGNKKWINSIFVRSSSNVYNQSLISAMILNYGEKKTTKFLNGFVNNFARTPSGGDREQIRAVASGNGKLAIVNSYYYIKMISDGNKKVIDNTQPYFPVDDKMSTHINISGIGIIKNSENKKNSKKLLEFLVSNEAQRIYSEKNYEYPVVKGITMSEKYKKYLNFIPDDIALSQLEIFNSKALIISDKAGWR